MDLQIYIFTYASSEYSILRQSKKPLDLIPEMRFWLLDPDRKSKKMLWKEMNKVLLGCRENDKAFMSKTGTDVPPHIDVFTFCLNCKKVNLGIAPTAHMNFDILKANFRKIVFVAMKSNSRCVFCNSLSVPMGFTYNSLSWALRIKREDRELVQKYMKVAGSLEHHPNRVEKFTTYVVTTFGINMVFFCDLYRKDGRISFKKDRIMSGKNPLSESVALPQLSESLLKSLREMI